LRSVNLELTNRFVTEKLMPRNSFVLDRMDLFYGLIIDLHFYDTQKEIAGSTFGFLAYGSGSKSKSV
jgi:hydroxymethylglutaryl-CoA synthase